MAKISPDLALQWHPTKNEKNPDDYTAGSSKKVWWKCDKGHEWEAEIGARSRGNGCPYCSGRRITPGVNDLATVKPAVAAQWHPTKNGDLSPTTLAPTSSKKVWWLAEDGHEWQAPIINRSETAGCAVCFGSIIVQGVNDLASQRPDILPYIHPTKNKKFDPEKVAKTSRKKIWWICDQGHDWEQSIEMFSSCPVCSGRKPVKGVNDLVTLYPDLAREWDEEKNGSPADMTTLFSLYKTRFWTCDNKHSWEASIQERIDGKTCRVCSGEVVLAGFNDLATTHPELMKQWDYEKNHSPETLSASSQKIVWWICDEGHNWQTVINQRAKGKNNCSVCSNQKIVAGINDLKTLRPDLMEQWDWENNEIDPSTISTASAVKVQWVCENGHNWTVAAGVRINHGTGCPYCSHRKFLSGYNDLATVFPDIAAEWDYEKNDMSPSEVGSGANKKVWWKCDKGHSYDMSIVIRTSSNQECPLCSGRRVVAGQNDLASLRPDIARQWSSKNTLSPTEVSEQSNRKVWWVCDKGHEWKTSVQMRTLTGNACPYCANKKVLAGFNDFATLNPKAAQYWHPTKNGSLLPSMVARGSKKKVWWLCDKGHEVQALVTDRNRGIGCRNCAVLSSKGEREMADFIESLGFDIVRNDRSRMGNRKEIDIFVPSLNMGFEYDGLYWHSTAVRSDTDLHYTKFKDCEDRGITLIQFWEDEWNDKQEIVKRLIERKLGVSKGKRIFARKTEIVEVTQDEADTFLEDNHIQGSVPIAHHLGLRFEGDLVAVLALKIESNRDASEDGDSKAGNILRYATSENVIGGFGKLLSFVEKNFDLDSVYTFSDNRVSRGDLYERLGFTLTSELLPDYSYVYNWERFHKSRFRLERFRKDPDLFFEEGKSERELAELNEIERIWDAGKRKWVKNLRRKQGELPPVPMRDKFCPNKC